MRNFTDIKKILQYSFVFLFFIVCGPLFADDNGQIININQNYKIAFTDLGSRFLSQGDVVKIYLNTDEFLYLQVLESSAILSKLGPSKVEGFQTNLNNFQRIAVGNEVVKVNHTQEKKESSELNEKSKMRLNELIAKNQTQNEEHAAPVQSNVKETLTQLKVHLDNMRKLIDENN